MDEKEQISRRTLRVQDAGLSEYPSDSEYIKKTSREERFQGDDGVAARVGSGRRKEDRRIEQGLPISRVEVTNPSRETSPVS